VERGTGSMMFPVPLFFAVDSIEENHFMNAQALCLPKPDVMRQGFI